MMAFFFDDANQQNNADNADNAQIAAGNHQRQQGADTGGRQRGQNGDRVDIAFVQHAQHDINRDDGGQDQPQGIAQRGFESQRRALVTGAYA